MGHVEEADALRAGELIDLFTAMMLTQIDGDGRQEILSDWEARRRGDGPEPEPSGPIPRICGPDALMHFAMHPLS